MRFAAADRNGRIVASIDTAYTTKTENDFSAMTVWGVFSGDVGTMRAEAFVNARGQRRNNAEEAARFEAEVARHPDLTADVCQFSRGRVEHFAAFREYARDRVNDAERFG